MRTNFSKHNVIHNNIERNVHNIYMLYIYNIYV